MLFHILQYYRRLRAGGGGSSPEILFGLFLPISVFGSQSIDFIQTQNFGSPPVALRKSIFSGKYVSIICLYIHYLRSPTYMGVQKYIGFLVSLLISSAGQTSLPLSNVIVCAVIFRNRLSVLILRLSAFFARQISRRTDICFYALLRHHGAFVIFTA